jgi:putative transposase
MTKFLIPFLGWVYLVIVLNWYTKKIVGWDLYLRSRFTEWGRVLEISIQREFPDGVRHRGLNVISDNGSQLTSVSFMREMYTFGIDQIFTSYDNPKGNAETGRMMRTMKEEVSGSTNSPVWKRQSRGWVNGSRRIITSSMFIRSWDISVRRNLKNSI